MPYEVRISLFMASVWLIGCAVFWVAARVEAWIRTRWILGRRT